MPKRSRGDSALLYKVTELSTVDEQSLERSINEGVSEGWRFDGMHFAMRESSKRPSMAFLVFTRQGKATSPTRSAASSHRRLRQLAGLEEEA